MRAHGVSRTRAFLVAAVAIGVTFGAPGDVRAAAPPNDNLANATGVQLPASLPGTNLGATIEADEPAGTLGTMTKTVWYRLVPQTTTGVLVRLTLGSLTAPEMAARHKPASGPMVELAWEQETYDGTHDDLWFQAVAGGTYYLQLGQIPGGGGGTYTIAFSATDRRPSAGTASISVAARQLGQDGLVPALVRWRPVAVDGSPVWNTSTEISTDGGPWTWRGVTSVTSTAVWGYTGHTYRFRVKVVDEAGRWSEWSTTPLIEPALYQQTSSRATWTGSWWRSISDTFSAGSARSSRTAGSKVTFTFTGRGIAVVGTAAATRGRARISVDGVSKGWIDFGVAPAGARLGTRLPVWSWTGSASGSHRITLLVEGTAGRPRVDIDAFVVLR